MKTYFDSSALVAVYATQQFSARVRREVAATRGIPYTPLHDLEIRNALRVLHGRGVLEAHELRGLLTQIDDDREQARLVDAGVDLYAVFARAVALSAAHTAKVLCRSLDILHVAAALEIRCARFVSGDERQLRLARAEGLEPVDIRRRTRPTSRRPR